MLLRCEYLAADALAQRGVGAVLSRIGAALVMLVVQLVGRLVALFGIAVGYWISNLLYDVGLWPLGAIVRIFLLFSFLGWLISVPIGLIAVGAVLFVRLDDGTQADEERALLNDLLPEWIPGRWRDSVLMRAGSFPLTLSDQHCAMEDPFRQALAEVFGAAACAVCGHGVAQLSPRPFGAPFTDPETGREMVALMGATPDDFLVALSDEAFAAFRGHLLGKAIKPGSYLCRVVGRDAAWEIRQQRRQPRGNRRTA